MNAIAPVLAAPPVPLIPDDAPFSPIQRAWLNGFLAGLFGPGQDVGNASAGAAAEAEDFPWHDPAIELEERLSLSEGRPLARRLMSAMAQLDCGQCGYLCQTYAEALAEGRETAPGLCVPGAKQTRLTVKAILAEAPPPETAAAPAAEPHRPSAPVRVRSAARLTGPQSGKDVRHVVIDLAGSGLSYLPGDSLSLACPNDPALVAAVIATIGATGQEPVPGDTEAGTTLREALIRHRDIAWPQETVTDALAEIATDPGEAAMLRALSSGDDGALEGYDLLDLLETFRSARPRPEALVACLPPLRARLYSIASSQGAVGEEVHLCVSAVRAPRRERVRFGVASVHLAERAPDGEPLVAAIHESTFRLPADPSVGIVMIGPGTGIAPFRAFLQHRAAGARDGAASGPAWLFFGDRCQADDHLYREETEAFLADGTLTRLDLAFSRDQDEKIYVQDRMWQAADELWAWLEQGAHLYVCGDASRMARDVDDTLRRIVAKGAGIDADAARARVAALAREGRYQRDVY